MTQTIIICSSVIIIVTLICYTNYKINTFRANHEALSEIYNRLNWLKKDYELNRNTLNKIWDNIQEVKQYLQKVVKHNNK